MTRYCPMSSSKPCPVPYENKSIFDVYDMPASIFPENVLETLKTLPSKDVIFYTKLREIFPTIVMNLQQFRNMYTTMLELKCFRPEEVTYMVNCEPELTLVTIEAVKKTKSDEYHCETKEVLRIPSNVDISGMKIDFTNEGILIIRAPYFCHETRTEMCSTRRCDRLMSRFPLVNEIARKTLARQWGFNMTQEMLDVATTIISLSLRDPSQILFPNFVGDETKNEYLVMLDFCFEVTNLTKEDVKFDVDNKNHVLVMEVKKNWNLSLTKSLDEVEFSYKRKLNLPLPLKLDKMTAKILPLGLIRLTIPVVFTEKPINMNGVPIKV